MNGRPLKSNNIFLSATLWRSDRLVFFVSGRLSDVSEALMADSGLGGFDWRLQMTRFGGEGEGGSHGVHTWGQICNYNPPPPSWVRSSVNPPTKRPSRLRHDCLFSNESRENWSSELICRFHDRMGMRADLWLTPSLLQVGTHFSQLIIILQNFTTSIPLNEAQGALWTK